MLWVLIRDSNVYPQHMFLWRIVQNYPSIITKYPPYLFHWHSKQTKSQQKADSDNKNKPEQNTTLEWSVVNHNKTPPYSGGLNWFYAWSTFCQRFCCGSETYKLFGSSEHWRLKFGP